jgi:magnesium chelatase subunit H
MVLWGIDNINTEGEAVAQALWLLGLRPRRDSLNRATDVEVIALEDLRRPRIDIVMTISGIFRDLFG